MNLGPKMRDGLRVYAEMERDKVALPFDFADVRLMRMGYPAKVAASIIDRLDRRGFIEYGVSARSGWLTDEGRAALSTPRSTPQGGVR